MAVTQISNVLGIINPVKEIIGKCHSRGVAVLVDGAQGVVHCKVDVQDLEYVYKKNNGVDVSGEILKRVEAKKEENRKLAELHKSEREVSTSEIGEVARGVTLGSTTKAMNAVINSKDEPIIENDGQSHDEE